MVKHFPIKWDEIEPRIRPHVKALRDAGYNTTGSCGHDMWIMIDMPPSDLLRLYADLQRLGYGDLSITYEIEDGYHMFQRAKVTFGGKLAGDEKPYDYVLLKVDPESHPLYFVIKARRWPDHPPPDHDNDSYFYNEHTCPTNWTDDIVAVVGNGEVDPHGVATFVRRVTPPENDVAEITDEWYKLFPELG